MLRIVDTEFLPVFQFVILKHVDPDILNYNTAVVSRGCENLVCHTRGGKKGQGSSRIR